MGGIGGIKIGDDKDGVMGLSWIYGVGKRGCKGMVGGGGMGEDVKKSEVCEGEMERVGEEVGKFVVEGDVGGEMRMRMKGVMDVGWYGGLGDGGGVGVGGEGRKRKGGRGKGGGKGMKK